MFAFFWEVGANNRKSRTRENIMSASRIADDKSAPRGVARTYINLRNGFMKTGGMVLDISSGGVDVEMHNTSGMNFGDKVELHSEEIGYIDGMIRWVKPRRIGIEFDRTTNNAAKVAAFLKNAQF
jgi:hypothetical protein